MHCDNLVTKCFPDRPIWAEPPVYPIYGSQPPPGAEPSRLFPNSNANSDRNSWNTIRVTTVHQRLHVSNLRARRPDVANLGVLDYHTEGLLRREDFIISTRFARMDQTECFIVSHIERRRRGMTDRWQYESTWFLAKLRSRSLLEYTSASVHSILRLLLCLLISLKYLLLGNRASILRARTPEMSLRKEHHRHTF